MSRKSSKKKKEIVKQYHKIRDSAEERYPGVSDIVALQMEFTAIMRKTHSPAFPTLPFCTSNSSASTC
jgi:hypothetical protein